MSPPPPAPPPISQFWPPLPPGGSASLRSMCVDYKETGNWTEALQTKLLADFRGRKITLIVPVDPYSGEAYTAERRYARMILDLKQVHDLDITYHVLLDFMATYKLARSDADDDTTYLVIGEMTDLTHEVVNRLRAHGNKVFSIDDSLCFGCDHPKGGCTAQYGVPMGCPNLPEDIRWTSAIADRMYFTPFGSEPEDFYPDKAGEPMMFVDASKPWVGGMDAGQFVALMHQQFPWMRLTVLGGDLEDTPLRVGSHHFLRDLPDDEFRMYLRRSWFYASGIKSTYELSLADAATAGAVLIDVGGTSKAAVRPDTAVTICGDASSHQWRQNVARCQNATNEFENMEDEATSKVGDILQRYKTENLASVTAMWGVRYHGPDYVRLNLLCSLRADEFGDHAKWSSQQFALAPSSGPTLNHTQHNVTTPPAPAAATPNHTEQNAIVRPNASAAKRTARVAEAAMLAAATGAMLPPQADRER